MASGMTIRTVMATTAGPISEMFASLDADLRFMPVHPG